MSNCYTVVAAMESVSCGLDAAIALLRTLEPGFSAAEKDLGPEGVLSARHGDSDFSAEYSMKSNTLFISAETNGSSDDLPEEFFAALGSIITAAGLPYLEFGVGFTSDRVTPSSVGGTAFRVMASGDLVSPEIVWPT